MHADSRTLEDHVTPGVAPPPLLYPQVERVVQVDVGGTDASAGHRAQITLLLVPSSSTAAFNHLRINRTMRVSATRCSMNFNSQSRY